MMYKISVIVPIYNSERYIARCVRSLFSQSLDSIEYVFINDSSTDGSVAIIKNILKEYPSRYNDVKIFHHPVNMGVAQARQTGIENVTGTYTIHCDPDDWMDDDYLEQMYICAENTTADLVFSDYKEEYDNRSIYKPQTLREISVNQLKKGLTTNIWGGLWNKLIRTSVFYNKINFLKGVNYQEDLLFCYKCLCKVKNISYLCVGGVSLQQNKQSINNFKA